MPLNDIKNVCNCEIKETQTKVFFSRPATRPDKTNAPEEKNKKKGKRLAITEKRTRNLSRWAQSRNIH